MEKVLIGKIVNTHGIKGELKILSETDFPTRRYHPGNSVFIGTPEGFEEYHVRQYRPHQGFDLLVLRGLEDINLVERFRGCEIWAEDHPLSGLTPNEFQLATLLGAIVLQENGKTVGKVTGSRTYPQGDYLEVTRQDGTIALIPFRDEFIGKIDLAARTIEIVEMEGLL